jgi:hypothetical protein
VNDPTPGSCDHAITPAQGSARRLDGTPADLARPSHYPAEAVCARCGRPVRCERWFRAGWRHVERFTDPNPGKGEQVTETAIRPDAGTDLVP